MKIVHPAKYSTELLPVMARYVDGARTILDPFAGTGRVGLLKQHLTVQPFIWANEIEEAWAMQGRGNGCDMIRVGDARTMGRLLIDELSQDIHAIVTSPAYGNRMADHCDWAPGRKHSTYTSAYRQTVGDEHATLQPANAGAMQWGPGYRELHRAVWRECWRVLGPGGRIVLNVADHYRDGVLQGVPEWHVSALLALGYRLIAVEEVKTSRFGFGANSEKRSPELVIVFEKPGDGPAWIWQPAGRVRVGCGTCDLSRFSSRCWGDGWIRRSRRSQAAGDWVRPVAALRWQPTRCRRRSLGLSPSRGHAA